MRETTGNGYEAFTKIINETINLLRFMLFGAACLGAGFFCGQAKVYERFVSPEIIKAAAVEAEVRVALDD